MPYTKFRVIDETPQTTSDPKTTADEWAAIKPKGAATMTQITQLAGAAGHAVAQADGNMARICEGNFSLALGGNYTAYIQHNDSGAPANNQWIKYDFVIPGTGEPDGNNDITLRVKKVGNDYIGTLESDSGQWSDPSNRITGATGSQPS